LNVKTGIGFGLIYVPAIVSVGYYFDKKRSFATGIAVCGSGIGTFVLSPINRLLFDEYGVNGAFLITAGFVFNLVACGFLIRPISIEPSEMKKRAKLNSAITSVVVDANNNNNSNKMLIYRGTGENTSADYVGETRQFVENTAANNMNSHTSSPLNNPKILVSDENDQVVEHVSGKIKKITESMPMNINGESSGDGGANTGVPNTTTSSPSQHVNYQDNRNSNVNKFATSLPMLSDNATRRSGRTRTLSRNSQFMASNSAMDMMVMVRSLQNIPVINEELDAGRKQWKVKELKDGLLDKMKNAIDLSLLKDFVFLFFAISNFLTSLGFNTPFIYIVDQALLLNIAPAKADLLLSTIGISNMVGRIFLGIVSNVNGVNRLYLYATVITICGVATTIEPFCTTFTGLLIFSIVFGFTSGGYVSITSVLLVDLFGLEQLTDAFGILLVFQGLAVLIGPPGVGIMYDILKSYVLPFVVTGVLLTISGLMCFLLPCFRKKEEVA
jgi:MFS family permease